MKLHFAPKGILQIDDARIVFRNFSGAASQYNREGERNFSVAIPDEDMYDALRDEGWNVKKKPLRDGEEVPFMHLPVKVKFNDKGPDVYLKSGDRVNELDEESVEILDNIDILSVDLDIRPYDWEVNGKTGRTAYLQAINVIQRVDRFGARYAEDEN